MVDLVDGLEFGIDFLQQRVAKRMKSAESDAFGAFRIGLAAFARRRDHAMLHFRRRFVRERQPQDFLARKFRLRFEQIADALGDDARLSRARAGHHHQRPFAMVHGGALFRIQLNSRGRSAGVFKQFSHG